MGRTQGKINKVLSALGFMALLLNSAPSNAHLLGIAWNDMGNSTVRFYAEVAHDLGEEPWYTGDTDSLDIYLGSLQIGPWATREYHDWSGVVTDTTFAELGIDDWAYWDYTDEHSTIRDYHPDSHRGGPESMGDFFFVDVHDFVTGDYLLTGQDAGALTRPVSYNYLNAHIALHEPTSVPEPSGIALIGAGLAGLVITRRRRTSKA